MRHVTFSRERKTEREYSTTPTFLFISRFLHVAARAIDRSIQRSVRTIVLVLYYVYLAESIATAALRWNTRYEDMRYGRLIREIKIESDA